MDICVCERNREREWGWKKEKKKERKKEKKKERKMIFTQFFSVLPKQFLSYLSLHFWTFLLPFWSISMFFFYDLFDMVAAHALWHFISGCWLLSITFLANHDSCQLKTNTGRDIRSNFSVLSMLIRLNIFLVFCFFFLFTVVYFFWVFLGVGGSLFIFIVNFLLVFFNVLAFTRFLPLICFFQPFLKSKVRFLATIIQEPTGWKNKK